MKSVLQWGPFFSHHYLPFIIYLGSDAPVFPLPLLSYSAHFLGKVSHSVAELSPDGAHCKAMGPPRCTPGSALSSQVACRRPPESGKDGGRLILLSIWGGGRILGKESFQRFPAKETSSDERFGFFSMRFSGLEQFLPFATPRLEGQWAIAPPSGKYGAGKTREGLAMFEVVCIRGDARRGPMLVPAVALRR